MAPKVQRRCLQMEQYLKAPAQNVAALETVCAELHRLLGVLRMVGLDGLVVFCAEFERALSELKANPKQVSDLYRDVLRHALFAVTHFLDALADAAGAFKPFPLQPWLAMSPYEVARWQAKEQLSAEATRAEWRARRQATGEAGTMFGVRLVERQQKEPLVLE